MTESTPTTEERTEKVPPTKSNMNYHRLAEDVAAGSIAALAITGVALAFVGGAVLTAGIGELAFFVYIALSLGGIPAFLIWIGF